MFEVDRYYLFLKLYGKQVLSVQQAGMERSWIRSLRSKDNLLKILHHKTTGYKDSFEYSTSKI